MTPMPFENLLVDRDGPVALITINRPRVLNALNSATLDELRRVVLELKQDDGVRAIVVTGAGEKAFVAGADINELAVLSPAAGREHALAAQAPIAVRYIIAAINKGVEMGFAESAVFEATLFGLVASTADMREGTQAFLEKRKPEFKGR